MGPLLCDVQPIEHGQHFAGIVQPGVITLTQPKAPEAKIRGPRRVLVGSRPRVQGVLKGVRRGPLGERVGQTRDPLSYQPCSTANLKFTGLTQKALIGIFSQKFRSTCKFWVNPVNFTSQAHVGDHEGQAGRARRLRARAPLPDPAPLLHGQRAVRRRHGRRVQTGRRCHRAPPRPDLLSGIPMGDSRRRSRMLALPPPGVGVRCLAPARGQASTRVRTSTCSPF